MRCSIRLVLTRIRGLQNNAGSRPQSRLRRCRPRPAKPTKARKELPKDLYPSMPVYPGAKVRARPQAKGAMREIMFSSDAQMQADGGLLQGPLKKKRLFTITSSLIMPARKQWSLRLPLQRAPRQHHALSEAIRIRRKMTIDLIYELPPHVMSR